MIVSGFDLYLLIVLIQFLKAFGGIRTDDHTVNMYLRQIKMSHICMTCKEVLYTVGAQHANCTAHETYCFRQTLLWH